MKIELYKNSNIVNKDSDSSNLVFKSSNILVYCNDDYFEFKNTNGDTYIIIGKIFGIYNGIDLNKFDNEKQLKNSLSNYSVENIGGTAAYNSRISFRIKFVPYTNILLPEDSWYSDMINLNTIDAGNTISGSIPVSDLLSLDGVTYFSVNGYLSFLGYSY